jgi:hypothetical protein
MRAPHPFAYLRERADVLRCCGNPKNLVVQRLRPDLLRAVCTRCGRGHRKFLCEPGTMLARTLQAMAAPPLRLLYDHTGQLIVPSPA